MSSLKQPPVFNPDGGDNYADWKNDLEVWCMLTDGKINQGPAVFLSLQYRVMRETQSDLSQKKI